MDIVTLALSRKYTDKKVADIAKALTYKGNVPTRNDLPVTGMRKGYVYTTTDDGAEYLWVSDNATGTLDDYIELGSGKYTVTIDV